MFIYQSKQVINNLEGILITLNKVFDLILADSKLTNIDKIDKS